MILTILPEALAAFGIFLGRGDQIEQAGDLFRWAFPAEGLEFFRGQAGFQMRDHIEALPPAIQDFEARPVIVTATAAVAEVYRAAQPGAAHFEVIKGHVLKQTDLVINQSHDQFYFILLRASGLGKSVNTSRDVCMSSSSMQTSVNWPSKYLS